MERQKHLRDKPDGDRNVKRVLYDPLCSVHQNVGLTHVQLETFLSRETFVKPTTILMQ